MAERKLFVEEGACIACLSCVTICAVQNAGVSSPSSSRIAVSPSLFDGEHQITWCRQCADAPCAEACPVGAIKWTEDRAYLFVDYADCTRCQACVSACSYGAMLWDFDGDKPAKCTTCEGEPACVVMCPTDCLAWETPAEREARLAVRDKVS